MLEKTEESSRQILVISKQWISMIIKMILILSKKVISSKCLLKTRKWALKHTAPMDKLLFKIPTSYGSQEQPHSNFYHPRRRGQRL